MLKFFLGVGAAGAAVLGLLVLAGAPEAGDAGGATNAGLAQSAHYESASLSRRDFSDLGFSVHAPEDWRMLTGAEVRKLATQRGKPFGSSDKILGVIVSANGQNGRGMVVFAMDDTKGTPLKKLESFDIGLSLSGMINSTGRKAKVTTQPYGHDLGGVDAASMVLETKTLKGSEIDLGITMIALPKRPITALLVTRDDRQRDEAQAILASFSRH